MRILFFSFILLIKSLPCFSWGATGHEMVGNIAKVYARKAVVDSVNKYFDGLSWGSAANWMDEMRSNSSYDYLRPMHYIDITKDSVYAKTEEGNIVSELEN